MGRQPPNRISYINNELALPSNMASHLLEIEIHFGRLARAFEMQQRPAAGIRIVDTQARSIPETPSH